MTTNRKKTPRRVCVLPGIGDLPYNEIARRVSVDAVHLLLFISEECSIWPCVSIDTIRKKFEGAGHMYLVWPFESLLGELVGAGLVEVLKFGKNERPS